MTLAWRDAHRHPRHPPHAALITDWVVPMPPNAIKADITTPVMSPHREAWQLKTR